MRFLRCCLVILAAAASAQAEDVWRGLRWDMSPRRAAQTLRRQGLKVREERLAKDQTTHVDAEVDGWDVTVYFDDDGKMIQILVSTGALTKDAAAAAKERLTKRFGAVKDTTQRAQLTWGNRIGGDGPWTTLLVVHIPGEGWHVREEYGYYEARGPVGAFDLTWGQTAPDVEQRLRAAGFEAHTTAMLLDPCKAPNAPFFCEPDASVNVVFKKGDDEGVADVHKKRGLIEITFNARVASYAEGLARATPIEAFRGPASEIEDATITTWWGETTDVELDLRLTKPEGTLSAIEKYLPVWFTRSRD